MSDGKKDSLNKKITIKNKKEAEKVLNKKKSINTKTKKTPVPSKAKTKTTKKTIQENNKKIDNNTKKKIETKKIKKPQKKQEKAKLVLPKEWQVKSTKNNKNLKNKKIEQSDNLSNKLKNSIFEEVTEQEIIENKLRNKSKNKKRTITLIVLLFIIMIAFFVIIKYKESLKEKLKVYEEYTIGEKVVLKDSSIWYVIVHSDNTNSTVKIIKETQIDVNNDGKYDAKDKMKYNSSNTAVYDIADKDSVAYYLENDYKSKLSEKIGKIESIGILTSKEFVKARGKMGYDYEWSEGNWLANASLDTWWINSSQNEKVYAVTKIGSYKLYNANTTNYIRPVITINKDLVEKKD